MIDVLFLAVDRDEDVPHEPTVGVEDIVRFIDRGPHHASNRARASRVQKFIEFDGCRLAEVLAKVPALRVERLTLLGS
jgi:hypothetical protein